MITTSSQTMLLSYVKELNNTILGPLLILTLLGAGLYFTVRLGLIQRFVFKALGKTFKGLTRQKKATAKEGMSSFQALATAVAAQLGTGNIVGIATAIVAGGPGAVFWLWVSIFFGMATNYAEAVLAQIYRTKTAEGHVIGGPAYYISRGLKSKVLAYIFAIVAVFALGFMGTIVQTNAITLTVTNVWDVNPLYIGIFVAIIVAIVLIGGITRIASFSSKIVPLMAVVYFLAGITVIIINYDQIIPAFQSIFTYAFNPESVGGGVLGYTVMHALRYGVARGLYSNEAGLGTTPHAHAVAQVKKPYEQGLTAMVGVATNLIICTLSALIVLVSTAALGKPDVSAVQDSFGLFFGQGGSIFIAVTLFFFSLTTIISWYFFAVQNLRFLTGERFIRPFRIMVVLFVVLGSVLEVDLAWELMDTFNVFLVVPNVIALLYLSKEIVTEGRLLQKDVKNKEF